MDDVAFTFDPRDFMNGINSILTKLGEFQNVIGNVANKSTELMKKPEKQARENVKAQNKSKESAKEHGVAMEDALMRVGKKVAGLAAAYFGLSAVMRRLPEVGKTFSIMGDIISRNLLYPLRRELTPYLQKLLNWTRDHRAMFVRWGSTLVNIFRGVVQVVKGLIDALKPIFKAVTGVFKRFVGDSMRSMSDFMNILVFRVTVVAMFIIDALRPVFEKVGEWIERIGELAERFFRGFSAGLEGISPAANDFMELIREICGDISSLTDSLHGADGLGDALENVGDFMGTTFVALIRVATMALGIMWATLKGIFKTVKSLVQVLTGDFSGAWETFSSIGDDYVREFERMQTQMSAIGEGYRRMDQRMVQRGANREMARANNEAVERHRAGATPLARPANITASSQMQLSNSIRIENISIGEGATRGDAAMIGNTIGDAANRRIETAAQRHLIRDREARGEWMYNRGNM